MFDPDFYPQPGAESVVACSFDLDGLILLFVLPALTSSGGGGFGWVLAGAVTSSRCGGGRVPPLPPRVGGPSQPPSPFLAYFFGGRLNRLSLCLCLRLLVFLSLCLSSLPDTSYVAIRLVL